MVAIGEAAGEVVAAFAGIRPVVEAASMADAVAAAARLAEPGDAVVLAPGCASFDWYGSYGERGDDFARLVDGAAEGPGLMAAITGSVGHPAVRARLARRDAARRSTTSYVLLFGVLAVLGLVGLVMVLSATSVLAVREDRSSLVLLLPPARRRRHRVRAVPRDRARRLPTVAPVVARSSTSPPSRCCSPCSFPASAPRATGRRDGSTSASCSSSRRSWRSWRRCSSSATCAPAARRGSSGPTGSCGRRSCCSARSPCCSWPSRTSGRRSCSARPVLAVLFCAGVPGSMLARWSCAGLGLALLATLETDYRRARLLAFLDPWADPASTGYQIIQSQVSLGIGRLARRRARRAPGRSGASCRRRTPTSSSPSSARSSASSAPSSCSRLFGALGYLGLRAAAQAPDTFGRLLATGITTWFCVQAFVNIGAVVGILPITGVPLPFISFGSSAMLANMAAAGILCNICRHRGR